MSTGTSTRTPPVKVTENTTLNVFISLVGTLTDLQSSETAAEEHPNYITPVGRVLALYPIIEHPVVVTAI
jgi:hypothetical protein